MGLPAISRVMSRTNARPLSHCVAASLCVALAAVPSRGNGQQTVHIREPASCAGCQIRLELSVTLDGGRSADVGEPLTMGRLSDGRWLLNTMTVANAIAVFDSIGTHRRTIGRPGGGPGEFRIVGKFRVDRTDTVRVFDIGQRRMTILSPSLQVVSSRPVEVLRTGDLEVLPDGRIITAQNIPNVSRAGLPLHLVGIDGKIARSFGAENPEYRREDSQLMWRTIAPAGGDRVWAAHLAKYVLELWDFEGRKLRELVRDVPWFEPQNHFGFRNDDPGARPTPGILDLRMDSSGNLWVVVLVADENWKSGLGNVRGMYGRQTRGVSDENAYYDSIIDVIDPATGRLIASQRFDQRLQWVGETEYASSYRQNGAGVPFVDVFRVTLIPNPRR